MAEFFRKPGGDVPKRDFGKVMFSVPSVKEDAMLEKRAEAQRFVGSPTDTEDYRHTMWQLHEEYRQNAESHAKIAQELVNKSPAAFTYDSGRSSFEIETRRIEYAKMQAEFEVAQQAIWAGMQAWGKGQKPNEAFFRQLRVCLQQVEKQETEAFEASKQFPADLFRLEAWKQLARKKQILVNFEHYLRAL